jgi:DNA-directed RNA polymerase subunit RPC12/RpoP
MTTSKPPTPEAVEAAMKWMTKDIMNPLYVELVRQRDGDIWGETLKAARILAAEVQRLRAECEKLKHERNRAGMEARKEMMAALSAEQDKPQCEWEYDDAYSSFETECGKCWTFEEEPNAEDLTFCPKCGRRVKLRAPRGL